MHRNKRAGTLALVRCHRLHRTMPHCRTFARPLHRPPGQAALEYILILVFAADMVGAAAALLHALLAKAPCDLARWRAGTSYHQLFVDLAMA